MIDFKKLQINELLINIKTKNIFLYYLLNDKPLYKLYAVGIRCIVLSEWKHRIKVCRIQLRRWVWSSTCPLPVGTNRKNPLHHVPEMVPIMWRSRVTYRTCHPFEECFPNFKRSTCLWAQTWTHYSTLYWQ